MDLDAVVKELRDAKKVLPATDNLAAYELFTKVAEGGHIASQELLADIYENGRGMGKNRIKAIEHYEKNKYKAAVRLAKIYFDNIGTQPSDLDKAKQYIDLAYQIDDEEWDDENSNNEDQYYEYLDYLCDQIDRALKDREDEKLITATTDIAQMAILGYRFIAEKEYEKALRVLIPVAEAGNDEAQYKLADMYDHGKGTKKNCKLAIKWYEKAAAQGNIEATYRLAEVYCGDNDIAIVDIPKGIMLYEQVLKSGKNKAAYQLAKINLERDDLDNGKRYSELTVSTNALENKKNKLLGEIKTKMKEQAIRVKINAAVTPEAKFKTAIEFYHEDSYEVAFNLFSQAAEANHIRATEWLAHMYLNGYGIKADNGKAFILFQKAAEGNDAEAWNMLGRCYDEGWGCTRNLVEANKCFQKAAALNFVKAQFNLAINYFCGNGLVEDKAKALAWFKLAAGNGDNDALAWIGYCYLYGYGVEININKAQKFFQMASANRSKLPDKWKKEIDVVLKAARATAAEEVY